MDKNNLSFASSEKASAIKPTANYNVSIIHVSQKDAYSSAYTLCLTMHYRGLASNRQL